MEKELSTLKEKKELLKNEREKDTFFNDSLKKIEKEIKTIEKKLFSCYI